MCCFLFWGESSFCIIRIRQDVAPRQLLANTALICVKRTFKRRMSDEPKRLKQTCIFADLKLSLVVEEVEDVTSDGEDAVLLLPNVDICAKVYAYCEVGSTHILTADAYPRYDPSIHERPVYVGQPIQELKERDSQHLTSSLSTFDRDYTSRSQYIMVLLSERHFAAAEKEEDFKEETLHPAGEWMDYCETTYISTFDTFHTGLNRTKGGQGRGWLVAMSEATAKATYLRFLTVYMPAFRKYYEDHKEDRHANAPRTHTILGELINHIRSGHTRIPPQFEEELLTDMGLDLRDQKIVERDRRWEEEYMPAFRKYYEDHKETRHANAPGTHPILGKLISNIRSANTRIPPHFEEEMRRMQLLLCYENLARHVMRTLHRTVGCIETDVEAKQVLEEATKMHALLSSLRAGIKGRPALLKAGLFQLPFGKTPLGDGVARFVADMKRLDKKRSATRKRKRS